MATQSEVVAAEEEVGKNYAYFKNMRTKWLVDHISDYALIHRQKLVDFFESEKDAINTGVREYGWGKFSVQSVRDAPIDLGHQSNLIF